MLRQRAKVKTVIICQEACTKECKTRASLQAEDKAALNRATRAFSRPAGIFKLFRYAFLCHSDCLETLIGRPPSLDDLVPISDDQKQHASRSKRYHPAYEAQRTLPSRPEPQN